VPPRTLRRGRFAHISKPATSGAQNAGKPSLANGPRGWGMCPQNLKGGDPGGGTQNAPLSPRGWQNGGPGGQSPHGGGLWGVSPHKTKRGRVANPCNPATSGAQNAGKSLANGSGKLGVEGAQAPSQGVWGMCPQKRRGRAAHISNPPASGTQNAGKPSADEGGKLGGPGGASPLAGGLGDVPPKFSKKGRAANSCHPATSGAQNAGEPSAYEGGQIGGPGGEAPMAGAWGVPPTKPKGGEQPPLATPPTSGAQNAGEP
jgi:hypothetical protein